MFHNVHDNSTVEKLIAARAEIS